MKILRTLICLALLVAGLSGCEKIDVNKLEGTWTEQYDPTVFAMDGSVTFTFDGNNGYQLHVYDALSGEHQPCDVGLQQCHIQACKADVKGDGMAERGYDLFCRDLGL